MSRTLTLEEAQATLPELLAAVDPGEEVVITPDAEPVATLHRSARAQRRPQLGNCRGMLRSVVEDDDYVNDFTNYR